MRRLLAAVLLVLVAFPAAAEMCGPPAPAVSTPVAHADYDSRAAHRGAWRVCALTAADLTATELILAGGGREHDPLVKSRALRIGFGALGCLALHRVAGNEPLHARKWIIAGAIVRGLAAAWNIHVLTRADGQARLAR